jgi:hypothetical protein
MKTKAKTKAKTKTKTKTNQRGKRPGGALLRAMSQDELRAELKEKRGAKRRGA